MFDVKYAYVLTNKQTNKQTYTAKELGCDYVIDRKNIKHGQSIWDDMKHEIPNFDGFDIIFDANGVATLKDSYNHIKPTGLLLFHTFFFFSVLLVCFFVFFGMFYDTL